MKTICTATLLALAATLSASADTLTVCKFRHYGPYPLFGPLVVDSVDAKGSPLGKAAEAATPATLSLAGLEAGEMECGPMLPDAFPAVHTIAFDFENTSFAKPELEVKGLKNYTVYLDGSKVDGSTLAVRPSTHSVAIRYTTDPAADADSLYVALNSEADAGLALRTDGKRRYNLLDVLHGTKVTGVEMSPDGKYLITAYTTTGRGGNTTSRYTVRDVQTGRTVARLNHPVTWMPRGSRYFFSRTNVDGNELAAVDATTGEETVVASYVPQIYGMMFMPDEKRIVVSTLQEGAAEDPGVYRVLEPDDRQPGWRNRLGLAMLDTETGVAVPLTFGYHNVHLNDISDDGRHLLISTSESRLSKRPTTVTSIYSLDLETMQADTLVRRDGFVGTGLYSPDGTKVLVTGSPESLGGIGKNVPEGRIPSMVDNQLYLIDIASGNVTPLTRDFNPSVGSVKWSRADGKIYFTAEDRDRVNMFRLDPANGKITRLPLEEENVMGFSLPDAGKNIAWYGESASSPLSLYMFDSAKSRSQLLETPKKDMLADVQLGKCEAWDFVNSRGDTICGRFYLPPDFDPAKKYPMIVNYYGGCSPTERTFESRYPHNEYAAQGYVVYVIEPSGATGFGQEFSSRHVNTAGKGVADDIIEGTKQFCEEHPYVDSSKIGCIGASYGGFMTQYLQTVTDIFAAAISHAGISDHTSYWGEGYWGYSYSEVSMADSYPWSDPDLFVKQSPLFNADKVHTPLLFLHGDKDNNVPVGESIQMFTALKLLDRPTAFVAVADQDHHILDYDKRQKWQDTIFAWFAKYLKGDDTWWNHLYPPTPL